MYKARLLFQKTGAAAYISHLDLMKTIQRSLLRADLPAKYSEGFNPHIYLSVLVPLSTGYESLCDFCDFELNSEEMPENMVERLNAAMPEGLKAIAVASPLKAVGLVRFCTFDILFEEGNAEQMQEAFKTPITMEKHSKRGSREVVLNEYIKEIVFEQQKSGVLCKCTLNAGNDPLNPAYIAKGLEQAGLLNKDGHVKYIRTGIFDENMEGFM